MVYNETWLTYFQPMFHIYTHGKQQKCCYWCCGTLVENGLILTQRGFGNYKSDKVFKNWTSKICGRQPLKIVKGYRLLKADHTPSNFLKTVLHKFYLVYSWILCPKSTMATNRISERNWIEFCKRYQDQLLLKIWKLL